MPAESPQLPEKYDIVHRSEGQNTGFFRALWSAPDSPKILLSPAHEKDEHSYVARVTRDKILDELQAETTHILPKGTPKGMRDCLQKFVKQYPQESVRFEGFAQTGSQTWTVVARLTNSNVRLTLVEKEHGEWQVQQIEQLNLAELPHPPRLWQPGNEV